MSNLRGKSRKQRAKILKRKDVYVPAEARMEQPYYKLNPKKGK